MAGTGGHIITVGLLGGGALSLLPVAGVVMVASLISFILSYQARLSYLNTVLVLSFPLSMAVA